MTMKVVLGAGFLAVLGACAQPELILKGERFPVRADLEASIPLEGQPAPKAPGEPANQSAPISLPAQTSSAEWTHRAGNARHLMPHSALSETPRLAWSAPIGEGSSRKNRIVAAPVVSAGRIFPTMTASPVTSGLKA